MNRVSMLRKEAGLSQKELAARLGVQPSVVSKYENGGIQLQEDTLRQLVIIFDGVSADFILGLSDDRLLVSCHHLPSAGICVFSPRPSRSSL